jgi:hypothetical protein
MKKAQPNQVCSYASLFGKNPVSVDQAIKSAITSVKKLKDSVQVAAIAILIHAEKCGDYRKANELIEGLGNGVNQKALVEFFAKFGGFIISEEEKKFTGWSGADHIRSNFEKAKETAWYSLKQQKPFEGFNLDEAIQALIKRANGYNDKRTEAISANDEGTAKLINIDVEKLNRLKALIA